MANMVVYKDGQDKRHAWVKHLLNRISQNKNNLITVTGKTGSGKTYTAISICELMSEKNGVPFTSENIVFNLKDLMKLINSDKVKKGSCIIFDEPQISISNREFQSEANRVFNYLLTTFRHRNLTLFFCTPYEDLLDKTSRKLFHAKMTTMKINRQNQTCVVRPVEMSYVSTKEKFYEYFLVVCFKPRGKSKYVTTKVKQWAVPKPSKLMINRYEKKKLAFTTELNKTIEQRLEAFEVKSRKKLGIDDGKVKKPLTERQKKILELIKIHKKSGVVAKIMGLPIQKISQNLGYMRNKGYNV